MGRREQIPHLDYAGSRTTVECGLIRSGSGRMASIFPLPADVGPAPVPNVQLNSWRNPIAT